MARAIVTSQNASRPRQEPLYDIDSRTGASIEIFYADAVLAQSFGANGAGWFWWTCQSGCLPNCPPAGPFLTSYAAYRQVFSDCSPFKEEPLYQQSAIGLERKS
jgi:hypothetical protein